MRSCILAVTLTMLPAAMAIAQFGARPPAAPPNGEANPTEQDKTGNQGASRPENSGGPAGPPPNLMFQAIDADGDGVISKVELRKAVAALKTLDADNDGKITLAEVSTGATGGLASAPEQLLDRLMENDKNGDGKLSVDEVPERLLPMLQGADANNDGAIDRQELAAAIENAGPRFGQPGGWGPGGAYRGGRRGNRQPTGQFMQLDTNGDGRLTADEVPPQAMGMLRGGDQNNDGAIDAAELQAILSRQGDQARAWAAGLNADGQRRPGRGDQGRTRDRN